MLIATHLKIYAAHNINRYPLIYVVIVKEIFDKDLVRGTRYWLQDGLGHKVDW